MLLLWVTGQVYLNAVEPFSEVTPSVDCLARLLTIDGAPRAAAVQLAQDLSRHFADPGSLVPHKRWSSACAHISEPIVQRPLSVPGLVGVLLFVVQLGGLAGLITACKVITIIFDSEVNLPQTFEVSSDALRISPLAVGLVQVLEALGVTDRTLKLRVPYVHTRPVTDFAPCQNKLVDKLLAYCVTLSALGPYNVLIGLRVEVVELIEASSVFGAALTILEIPKSPAFLGLLWRADGSV